MKVEGLCILLQILLSLVATFQKLGFHFVFCFFFLYVIMVLNALRAGGSGLCREMDILLARYIFKQSEA